MFVVVIKPPLECDLKIFSVLIVRPSIDQLNSEGGLDASVLQIIVTLSPALASSGPTIVTLEGATI